MSDRESRRGLFKKASILALCAAGGVPASQLLAQQPIERIRGSSLKISLNAYSFSKLLNDFNKKREPGISLMALLDFCAKNNFDGIDPTGYFFPTYPEVPPDDYINTFKRKAFEL